MALPGQAALEGAEVGMEITTVHNTEETQGFRFQQPDIQGAVALHKEPAIHLKLCFQKPLIYFIHSTRT